MSVYRTISEKLAVAGAVAFVRPSFHLWRAILSPNAAAVAAEAVACFQPVRLARSTVLVQPVVEVQPVIVEPAVVPAAPVAPAPIGVSCWDTNGYCGGGCGGGCGGCGGGCGRLRWLWRLRLVASVALAASAVASVASAAAVAAAVAVAAAADAVRPSAIIRFAPASTLCGEPGPGIFRAGTTLFLFRGTYSPATIRRARRH